MTTAQALVGLCRRPKTDADRARAIRHLLDWLGCIAAAGNSPAAGAAARYLGVSGLQQMTSPDLPAEDAAFLSGALGNLLEMDDLHRASLLHVGDVVCPAALALALRRPSTPTQLLDALISGYEAAIRIGTAASASGYAPWYNSASCGVFGAAMAAADLLELSDDAAADALAQAGMGAAGLWQCRLDPGTGKQLATAQAARNGVVAAQLAAAGFSGPAHILEGEIGFFATYYPKADIARVTSTERDDFEIHAVSFKPWPACRHTHSAISAARALPSGPPQDVTVTTYDAAISFCDAPAPDTAHDARFSLQHCVAVALLRGAPALADFEQAARSDPDIAALRMRVQLREDPEFTRSFPARMAARVEITDSNGQQHVAECLHAPGDPEDPLSEADLQAKTLHNLRHGGATPGAASDLISTCHDLPEARDLDALRDALHVALTPAAP